MKGIVEQTQYISVAGEDEIYPFIHGSHRIYDIYGIAKEFNIDIEETECNFGGYRAWLICPVCEKRKLSLFYVDGIFQCKECGKLLYDRQTESKKSRTISKSIIDLMVFKYKWINNRSPIYKGKWTKRSRHLINKLLRLDRGFSKEEAREMGFDV